ARNGPSSRVTADSGNANAETPTSVRAAATAVGPASAGPATAGFAAAGAAAPAVDELDTPSVGAPAAAAPAARIVRPDKRLSSMVPTSSPNDRPESYFAGRNIELSPGF